MAWRKSPPPMSHFERKSAGSFSRMGNKGISNSVIVVVRAGTGPGPDGDDAADTANGCRNAEGNGGGVGMGAHACGGVVDTG